MPEYRRWRQCGGVYFFTVNLRRRDERLLVEHIVALRASVAHVRKNHPFVIDAAVVLPDHMHMIWTLPMSDDDFSTRWRLIKGGFARSIDIMPQLRHSDQKRGERGIWQRRFYEHLIRDEADFAAHVDYIHYNPVKHGHTLRPIDWPHSSIHRYVRKGVIGADWGTSGVACDLDLE